MKLCDLIQRFCEERENYKYCNSEDGIGVLVRADTSYMDMLMGLTEFLNKEGDIDSNCELEGTFVAEHGEDIIVYFPNIK